MSVLKNYKQSKLPLVAGIGATLGIITAGTLAVVVITEQQKRIEELERKVDHIINDMEK